MRHLLRRSLLSLLLLPLVAHHTQLRAQTEAVRVVLFFSPTCPHCHDVIQDHLPIFFGVYGGEPSVWVDQTVPETQLSLYLMYNDQLEILLVDATRPLGSRLFVADLESRGIAPSQGTVPRMVFGDDVLVGGGEIPARFHPLMRQAQAAGGLDWPAIPGLAEVTPAFPTAQTATVDSAADASPAADAPPDAADSATSGAADMAAETGDTLESTAPPSEQTDTADAAAPVVTSAATVDSTARPGTPQVADTATTDAVAPAADSVARPFDVVPGRSPTMAENLRRDPLGNAIAIAVLLAMIGSVFMIVMTERFQRAWSKPPAAILLVAAFGIVVAGYLTYVETSGAAAVCGPVGDCNTVQQSQYATLFGLIPVGLLGLVGYVAIIIAWFVWSVRSGTVSDYAVLSMSAIALVGTLFSIYLTFLEPFVIGATCAWCIASSVTITALLWLVAGSGKAAWARTRG